MDRALLIDVLPDRHGAAGRDLGLGGMGFSLGGAIGPVLAGQVVGLTGGYSMVWVMAVLVALVATVAIVPAKKVK
ncbi:hypothetical protein [Streptosporangium fragile]|uniref:hypothetical protein n=1 Tax=Streptosporangium fragile TaxID=46186 RepID=UPI0031EF8213